MYRLRIYQILLVLIFIISDNSLTGQSQIQELYKKSAREFKIGKYDDALITNINALKLAEQSKSCDQIAFAYLQVGKMQYYNKDRRQALAYFFKSKTLADSCKIDSIQHIVNHNIGAMYVELRITDSALFYLNTAINILKITNKYADLSKVNAVIADLYLVNNRDYVEAEKYIIEAEKYANKSNSITWVAFAKMKRGILLERLKKYDAALDTLNSALQLYNQIGAIEGRLYAMWIIMDVMVATNNPNSRSTISKYISIKDSIYRAEGASKIAEYKTIYETEKKETENRLLQQDNLLKQSKIDERNKTIIALVIGILLIVFIVIWRINIINLKKKQKELEATQAIQKEKERISRDLHDNVGGQLSYVLYSLDGINTDDKSKRTEITGNVNESVRNVISNLRETIWAINDEAISINDFSDKLKVYVRSMFRNTETKISFTENIQIDTQLNSLVGLNLYRICQETINNAFKHSNATELIVNITSDKHIMIEIKDNGVGFDLEAVSKEGFGLANIKSRAAEVGITLELESKLNDGVSYKLLV